MVRHHFILRDRGRQHIHRYAAECECGWVGVFRRTPAKARQIYLNHATPPSRARVRVYRQRPTPVDKLPEVLR